MTVEVRPEPERKEPSEKIPQKERTARAKALSQETPHFVPQERSQGTCVRAGVRGPRGRKTEDAQRKSGAAGDNVAPCRLEG